MPSIGRLVYFRSPGGHKNNALTIARGERPFSLSRCGRVNKEFSLDGLYTEALGVSMLIARNSRKQALLESAKDTHFGTSFARFVEIATELGFEKIYEEKVANTQDKLFVFWRTDGILLSVESYGKNVNSAHVWFNYQGEDRRSFLQCNGSLVTTHDNVDTYEMSRDVREGLRWFLDDIKKHGVLLSTWVAQPFLWLLNYDEPKHEGYDYQAINAAKIAQFPAHVQTAISGI